MRGKRPEETVSWTFTKKKNKRKISSSMSLFPY